MFVQEVNYYTYDVLIPEKKCLVHNVKRPLCQNRFLKPSYLASHRRHKHKNTPPFRNLITGANDHLSSLISFSKCDDKTVDINLFNS